MDPQDKQSMASVSDMDIQSSAYSHNTAIQKIQESQQEDEEEVKVPLKNIEVCVSNYMEPYSEDCDEGTSIM